MSGYSTFTEGDTVEELRENIIDALRFHFNDTKDTPRIVRLHFIKEEILNYAPDTEGCFSYRAIHTFEQIWLHISKINRKPSSIKK